ncbi:MAG TPA: hypothetical protein PLW10_10220 [Myxococcota bacterium]|nr:hypothetical protein [Myxococcota bacterium]
MTAHPNGSRICVGIENEALNGPAFALLLTSLYVLRFRGWTRPGRVAAYFAFFLILETIASRYLMPEGAFGGGLGLICLGLTVPVVVACVLVWLHERRQGEL